MVLEELFTTRFSRLLPAQYKDLFFVHLNLTLKSTWKKFLKASHLTWIIRTRLVS